MDKIQLIFDNALSNQLIYALGWTIVHSFWQCLLVAGVLAVTLKLTGRNSANLRYVQSIAALCMCALLSAITFAQYYQSIHQAGTLLDGMGEELALVYHQNWWTNLFIHINPYLDYVVLLWLFGIAFHFIVYLSDFRFSQRLTKVACHTMPIDWQHRFDCCVENMKLEQLVSFKLSTLVNIPCVVGYFKPVVLLPMEILTRLPVEQIEAIVLHELAHIKRHDYAVNMLQCLLKALFFFNPFVLWTCSKIDLERENACDDMAVAVCGDPLIFATSLSQFAEFEIGSHNVLAASKDKYQLLNRVKRLFAKRVGISASMEKLISAFCILCMGLTLGVNANTSAYVAQSQQASNQTLIKLDSTSSNKQRGPAQNNGMEAQRPVNTESQFSDLDADPTVEIAQVYAYTPESIELATQSVPESSVPQKAVITPVPDEDATPTMPSTKPVREVKVDAATDFLVMQNGRTETHQETTAEKLLEPEDSSHELSQNPGQLQVSLYKVLDTPFDLALYQGPAAPSGIGGITIVPLEMSHTKITSNYPVWEDDIRHNLLASKSGWNKEIEQYNAQSSKHNENYLIAEIHIPTIKHFRNMGSKRMNANADYFTPPSDKPHQINTLVQIRLIDSVSHQYLGLIEKEFYYNSQRRHFLNDYLVGWSEETQQLYWTAVMEFMLSELNQYITQLNKGNISLIEPNNDVKTGLLTIHRGKQEFQQSEDPITKNSDFHLALAR